MHFNTTLETHEKDWSLSLNDRIADFFRPVKVQVY